MSDPSPQAAPATDVRNGLAWAVYLGMSWTWVIGMFLPVLLIRDFGVGGWIVFAVPNVVGAAAMGWALRTREHGVRLVKQHERAASYFSYVTIAFHLFFLIWLVSRLAGTFVATAAVAASLAVMAPLLTTSVRQTTLAIAAMGTSVVIAMLAAGQGGLAWPTASGRESGFGLFTLACVCAVGFFTCPYLDLTFHRARQACGTHGESKLAFGIGFGAVFGSMILFTLLYAANVLSDRTLGMLIGIHIAVQAVFTIGVHASALRSATNDRGHGADLWVVSGLGIALGFIAHWLDLDGVRFGAVGGGEAIYRLFMSYYGLIAPAYVWLCLHPGRGFVRPHRTEVQVMVLTVALAAPFYTVGFFFGRMSWAIIGVLIVVGARLLIDFARRDALAEQRAEMRQANADPR